MNWASLPSARIGYYYLPDEKWTKKVDCKSMSNFFRPKRALYVVARRKNGRRSSDIAQGSTGGTTTELICCCTYAISPTIFVHSGRTKGAIPKIRRDRGIPLTFRPSTTTRSTPLTLIAHHHHTMTAKSSHKNNYTKLRSKQERRRQRLAAALDTTGD